ncbi:zinc finger MYM-type protein 1-like protein [Tanacetum coccineum]|uniref:Zinc finger MYM-type protein 1-like protein n=1 Tax=Tanacetum coccineum TaxID=301880 RepID=A0ABQ5ABN7_9ASTR
MSLILRYVNVSSTCVTIEESFLGFLNVDETTGKRLFDVTLDELKSLDLDIDDVRGQGYDNGSNMKGKHQGVQKGRDFFGIIQCIYTIFANSSKRWKILKDNVKGLTLKSLSITRWESRVESVKAIRFQISDIREALLQVAETNNDSLIQSQAKSLATNELGDFEFLVAIETGLSKAINDAKEIAVEMDIDPAIGSLITRFEQYKEYENIFGFLFSCDKLKSYDDKSLKLSCTQLEAALKNGERSDIDANELFMELRLLDNFLPSENMGPVDVLTFLKQRDCFPNALIAYRLLLTIPVTVASAKRSEEYERELFEIGKVGVVLVGGGEGEDDIDNLKRSERFRSEDVIEMKKNDVYERMAGPKENRVRVAEKEKAGKFCGSPDGGPMRINFDEVTSVHDDDKRKFVESKEEVKFTHHAHLELVMHDFGKFITHVLTSRTEYDVINIYLNDDEVLRLSHHPPVGVTCLKGGGVSSNVCLSDALTFLVQSLVFKDDAFASKYSKVYVAVASVIRRMAEGRRGCIRVGVLSFCGGESCVGAVVVLVLAVVFGHASQKCCSLTVALG